MGAYWIIIIVSCIAISWKRVQYRAGCCGCSCSSSLTSRLPALIWHLSVRVSRAIALNVECDVKNLIPVSNYRTYIHVFPSGSRAFAFKLCSACSGIVLCRAAQKVALFWEDDDDHMPFPTQHPQTWWSCAISQRRARRPMGEKSGATFQIVW